MPLLKRGSRRSSTPPAGHAPAGDAELVRRTLAGENGAFGLLYERHADRVFRYLLVRLRDPEPAHDLTQDVFLSALKALPQLQEPERFPGWLIRIAHNRLVNHWERHAARREAGSLDAVAGDGEDRTLPARVGPPTAAEGEPSAVETRLQVEGLVAALDNPTQRQVLALRFAAGLSLRETAELLGCTENAAKQHQYRALTQLRQRLGIQTPPEEGPRA